jgi:hypothetical protein
MQGDCLTVVIMARGSHDLEFPLTTRSGLTSRCHDRRKRVDRPCDHRSELALAPAVPSVSAYNAEKFPCIAIFSLTLSRSASTHAPTCRLSVIAGQMARMSTYGTQTLQTMIFQTLLASLE